MTSGFERICRFLYIYRDKRAMTGRATRRRGTLPLRIERLECRDVPTASFTFSGPLLPPESTQQAGSLEVSQHAAALRLSQMASQSALALITVSAPSLPKLDLPPISFPKLPTPKGVSEQAWGEAGRYAFPAAASTMAARNANRVEESVPRHERAVLRKYYGDLVDHVSVFWGADPLNRWTFGSYTVNLGGADAVAQTYGHKIYIRYAKEDLTVRERLTYLAHELVHVQQFERFGNSFSNFGYQYFREYKRAGLNYENNKLEREAYDNVNNNSAFLNKLVNDYYNETHPPSFCLVGLEGVLTIRNPTNSTVNYQFRWNDDDPWKSYSLGPHIRRTHYISDGCGEEQRSPQIRFDYSFSTGYQEKKYRLDYQDLPQAVSSSARKPGTLFLFKVVGNGLDLYRQ